jgi:hypothetical protein
VADSWSSYAFLIIFLPVVLRQELKLPNLRLSHAPSMGRGSGSPGRRLRVPPESDGFVHHPRHIVCHSINYLDAVCTPIWLGFCPVHLYIIAADLFCLHELCPIKIYNRPHCCSMPALAICPLVQAPSRWIPERAW